MDDQCSGLSCARVKFIFVTFHPVNELKGTVTEELRTARRQFLVAPVSDFEWRARQLRDHVRERPSEDPVMKKIAAKCATYHHLVAGQELVEARNSDSMFLIKSGSVTEAHDKLTFRLLREGCDRVDWPSE